MNILSITVQFLAQLDEILEGKSKIEKAGLCILPWLTQNVNNQTVSRSSTLVSDELYVNLNVRWISASQRNFRLSLKWFCQARTKNKVFSLQNVDTLKSTTKPFKDQQLRRRWNHMSLKAFFDFEVHILSTLSRFESDFGLTFWAFVSWCACRL